VRTYAWNARNQLAAVTATGLGSATFTYDGLGRRTTKTIGGTVTNFVYDGLTPVQQTGATTVTLLTGLGIDEFYTRTDTTGPRTLLTDALGSTLALTDAAGTIQTQYTYDPFGTTTTSGAPSTNSLQYTGRENDDTGLYYLRARYYLPSLHRFISEDRAAHAGGNPYTYVGNSPLNAVDPFGLFTIVMFGGAASSGPRGASASSGGNAGLTNLMGALKRGGERIESLNSGQVQDAIRLATHAQAAGEPVYIVGHSLGGSAGIDAALKLPQPPTHLYTIDPFLPNQSIPSNIPTTNFLQRDALPYGSYLQGQNVENLLIDGLGSLGHFTITEQVRDAIAEQILSGRK
jgi:RHS repeat-associated protein